MTDDLALLRDYREGRSEAAFEELVQRYVDLVYSTSLRVTSNPELARDVSQAVFIEFARKAGSIRDGAALPGWLYRVTCCQAKNAVRAEHRRRQRETEALTMADLNQPDSSSWETIAPLLDEAIQQLDKADQDAVIWRFFDEQSFREIGLALAVTEDAAQKRVSRAVDRLRGVLAERGVAVGAGALGLALTGSAAHAAPAGLAASLSTSALAATAGGAGAAASFLKATAMTKLQAAAIGAVLVATAVVTPMVMRGRANLRRDNEALRRQITELRNANESLSNQVASVWRSPSRVAISGAAHEPTMTSFRQVEEFVTAHSPELPRDQIEAFLRQNQRSVEGLLASFQVSHDPAYLREAATNAPNNPAVQFAVLANNLFPEEQRNWIDGFKASSPANALPWYFSALDYYKSNQPEQAASELAEATRRQIYSNYATQTAQAVEELYESAGWPSLAAKACAAGAASSSGPYLNALKALGSDVLQAQEQYSTQGDTGSAASMATIGMAMGDQLRGASSPMDQLVGMGIEKKILAQLDAGQTYDFLSGSVSNLQSQLDQQKQSIRQVMETRDQVRPTLDADQLNGYWEREKMYGEMYAMQWLQSKQSRQ